MHARTGKLFGVLVASSAIVLAGTTVIAQAEPTTPPGMVIAEPKGPTCDATVKSVASGPGSLMGLAKAQSSTALASIPAISTFSNAISGQVNPEVNVAAVLDNGPYIVFAPSDAAFAKLPPEQLESLKADPVALTALVYYHMALGILGPDDIEGTIYTQHGKPVIVKGSGGDITVNDAKVECGGIGADHMRLYIIDTVLDPAAAPTPVTTSTSTTSTTSATETTSATQTPAPETPATVTAPETTPATQTPAPGTVTTPAPPAAPAA
nr:fasciclin domain-containing protein [Mycobacterium sp.]